MKNKTVYILGAGFSNRAGCPTLDQFTNKGVLKEIESKIRRNKKELSKFKQIHKFIKNRIDEGYCKDNIEDILNHVAAASFLELGSWFELEDELYFASDIFNDLQWYIVKTLEQTTKSKLPKEYLDFVKKEVKINDTIITFNYDLVFENSASELNRKINYYLGKKTLKASILVLKLHGSVNWILCQRCKRAFKANNKYAVLESGLNSLKCPGCKSKKVEGAIIPPVLFKDTYYTGWIKDLWLKAFDELSTANKVVFIGFSMSENDAYARTLFKIGSNTNQSDKLRYLVRNKNIDKKLKDRYKSVLVGEEDIISFKKESF